MREVGHMSCEAERIGGHLTVAVGEFEGGDLSREDFIGKLLVILMMPKTLMRMTR